jgi:AcrR family transcriptional regulator
MQNETVAATAVQEQRETMVTAPDRRVRRTRKALQDALLTLMIDKGYEEISVRDIIDRADVGRSTFYTHYTDKDDLLQDGLADFRAIVEQSETAPHDGRRILSFSLNLFRHIHEHQHMARALFARPTRAPVLRQIEIILGDVVRAGLPDPPETQHAPTSVPPEALVRFVVGAYLSLMEWWLATDPPSAPEEIDRTFRALVIPTIRAATRRNA